MSTGRASLLLSFLCLLFANRPKLCYWEFINGLLALAGKVNGGQAPLESLIVEIISRPPNIDQTAVGIGQVHLSQTLMGVCHNRPASVLYCQSPYKIIHQTSPFVKLTDGVRRFWRRSRVPSQLLRLSGSGTWLPCLLTRLVSHIAPSPQRPLSHLILMPAAQETFCRRSLAMMGRKRRHRIP